MKKRKSQSLKVAQKRSLLYARLYCSISVMIGFDEEGQFLLSHQTTHFHVPEHPLIRQSKCVYFSSDWFGLGWMLSGRKKTQPAGTLFVYEDAWKVQKYLRKCLHFNVWLILRTFIFIFYSRKASYQLCLFCYCNQLFLDIKHFLVYW